MSIGSVRAVTEGGKNKLAISEFSKNELKTGKHVVL